MIDPTLSNPVEKEETLSRRDFLAAAAAISAALAAPAIIGAQNKSGSKLPIIGQGEYLFEVEHDWGQASLPSTLKYGNTHSVVQDGQGMIYVHHTVHADSQSPDTVVVFDPKGKFVRSWGAMFRGGAHGMHLQKEGKTEYLYFCDEKRGVVTKRTMKGEDVWTLGYPQNSPIYQKGPGSTGPGGAAGLNFNPTNVAVHPTTFDFWVCDGSGSNYVLHYKQKSSTSNPELVRVFGGPPPAPPAPVAADNAKGGPGAGKAGPGAGKGGQVAGKGGGGGAGKGGQGGGGAGKGTPAAPQPLDTLNSPHGNWIDTRDKTNVVLLIADQGNRRILRYTLDGKPIDTMEGTGQFCHFDQRNDLLVVPDLGSRVHLVKGNAVVASMGAPIPEKPDYKANPPRTTQNRADFVPGQFIAPHGACFDKEGNIFVVEWVEIGRVTKLRKV